MRGTGLETGLSVKWILCVTEPCILSSKSPCGLFLIDGVVSLLQTFHYIQANVP